MICVHCNKYFEIKRNYRNRKACITRCPDCKEEANSWQANKGGNTPTFMHFSKSGKQTPSGGEVLDINDI
jgi:hypothetical protein